MRRDAQQEQQPNRSMDRVASSFRAARRMQDPRHDGGGRMTDAERENLHGSLTTAAEFGTRQYNKKGE